MADTRVAVDGRELKLSNLDKVLYPAVGFTKGEVIAYYQRIAPVLIPHMRGRPLTLKRYPDGVEGTFFYEKNCPKHRPEWMPTMTVQYRRKLVSFCVVEELAALVWVANMASLELHTSLSRDDIDRPTCVVFDLDPGPPAGLNECARIAVRLRGLLDQLGLRSIVKTSGSKGMQLYIPLNTDVGYDATKSFALTLAQTLESRFPDETLSNMKRDLRPGKVFIDWSQNDDAKTTVCVYSLRARERPTVSTPLTWDEVSALADGDDPEAYRFTADDVVARVDEHGDLFAPLNDWEQELPAVSA